MSKRIEDSTIVEAEKAIRELSINQLEIGGKKVKLRTRLNEIKAEKNAIKDSKTKKLKAIQNTINKASTKLAKDSKRREKSRESDYFDSRITSKEREIQSLIQEIGTLDEKKSELNTIIARFKLHIKQLKQKK